MLETWVTECIGRSHEDHKPIPPNNEPSLVSLFAHNHISSPTLIQPELVEGQLFIGKVNSKSGDKYVDSKRDHVMWTIKEPKQNISMLTPTDLMPQPNKT